MTPGLGYTQILVIVDKFTKYVLLEPCTDEISSADTAEILHRRVLCEYGTPNMVISDRGPQFASLVWKELLKRWGSRVALAATHHPQTDGQSERAIQTLIRIIRAFARDLQDQWHEVLPDFQFAMNNSTSSSTRFSPFQLLRGCNPVSPLHFMLNTNTEDRLRRLGFSSMAWR